MNKCKKLDSNTCTCSTLHMTFNQMDILNRHGLLSFTVATSKLNYSNLKASEETCSENVLLSYSMTNFASGPGFT